MSSPSLSPEPATTEGMSVKDRARNWQGTPSSSPPPAPDAPKDTTLTTKSESELPPPPTIEEIEAIEKAAAATAAAAGADDNAGEICLTPSGSSLGNSNTNKQYSRQVSRVSGTGRSVRTTTPRAMAAAAAEKAAAAAAAAEDAASGPRRRGRSPTQPHRQQMQRDFSRRSISVDDPDRRPRQQRSSRGLAPTGNGAPPARRPVAKTAGGSRIVQNAVGTRKPAPPSRRVQHPNSSSASANNRRPLANGGRGGRAPYTAHGTPSAAAGTSNRTRQQHHKGQRSQPAPASALGGSRNFDITTSPPGMTEVAPKLRRHNSAPDMGMMDGEGEGEQQDVPFHDEPRQQQAPGTSEAGWGGGLPPTCGPAAARAAAAAAEAAQAPARPAGSTAGSSRYPATDRESFARTLNEEELDEVWKGLGEGVSQRGCGSEVAFDPADNAAVPGSPSGTAVSGAFPMLTANVLERHDQLADGCGSGGGSSGGARGGHANVMPMPKQMGDRSVEDMENGTRPSSKKSKGSSRSNVPQPQQTTLLGAIVSTAILVLWVAHLVFNILLLWPIVPDHYVWAVCFVPGVLGILLSFNSCRKSHRHCKPVADEEEAERPRRSGPHPCALPAHTLLLLSVVVCLGMHASAMLFCKKDMMLVFDEETLEPLCDKSLTLPVILDGVLLAVASLKASSLCWAWVLN